MVELIPPADYPVIIAGTDWTWRLWAYDDATGEPFNWLAAPWLVEAEIRGRSGELIARLASSGVNDGSITRHYDGELTLFMQAAVTVDLPVTRPYTNSTDVRVAGRRHRGAYAFDVTATNTDTEAVVALVSGFVTVQQLVTA